MPRNNPLPSLLVYLESDPDNPLGGAPIPTDNRDAVRWDLTRNHKRWPSGTDAPMLWLAFLAWSAAKRAGLFPGTFEDFQDQAIQVTTDQDSEDAELDPTQ